MATKLWVGTDTDNEGDWATAANWSPAGVPENGDDVILENSSQSVTDGLDQHLVQLASLTIRRTFTGHFGTAAAFVQVGASAGSINSHLGAGGPAGSARIRWDMGTLVACLLEIDYTPSNGVSGSLPVELICNNADHEIHIRGRSKVGIAAGTAQAAVADAIVISGNQAEVYMGAGVDVNTLESGGGRHVLEGDAAAIEVAGGLLVIEGTEGITTLFCRGGTVECNTVGTVAAIEVADSGYVNMLKSTKARTVSALKVSGPGSRCDWDPEIVVMASVVTGDGAVRVSGV